MNRNTLAQATSADQKMPPAYVLDEICRGTFVSEDDCEKIVDYLLQRLQKTNLNMKYKAILVLEHCYTHGHQVFKEIVQEEVDEIRKLTELFGAGDAGLGDEEKVRKVAQNLLLRISGGVTAPPNTHSGHARLSEQPGGGYYQGEYNREQQRGYDGAPRGGYGGAPQPGAHGGSQPGGYGGGPQPGNYGGFSQSGGYAGQQSGGYAGQQSGGYGGSMPGSYGGGSQPGGYDGAFQQGGYGRGSQQEGGFGGPQQGGYGGSGAMNAPSQHGQLPSAQRSMGAWSSAGYNQETPGQTQGYASGSASRFGQSTSGSYGPTSVGAFGQPINPNDFHPSNPRDNMPTKMLGDSKLSWRDKLKSKFRSRKDANPNAADGFQVNNFQGGELQNATSMPKKLSKMGVKVEIFKKHGKHEMKEAKGRWASRKMDQSVNQSLAQEDVYADTRLGGVADRAYTQPYQPNMGVGSGDNSGNYERRLIESLCAPAGLNKRPPEAELRNFVERAQTLDLQLVGDIILDKLMDSAWVVHLKALYVVEALLNEDKSGAWCEWFEENAGPIEDLQNAEKSSVRSKARDVLNLLGMETEEEIAHERAVPSPRLHPSQQPGSQVFSSHSNSHGGGGGMDILGMDELTLNPTSQHGQPAFATGRNVGPSPSPPPSSAHAFYHPNPAMPHSTQSLRPSTSPSQVTMNATNATTYPGNPSWDGANDPMSTRARKLSAMGKELFAQVNSPVASQAPGSAFSFI